MEALPIRLVNRALALLYVASGALATSSPVLQGEMRNDAAVYASGLTALGLGVITWFLPWQRWSRRWNLLLFPPAFALIAWDNYFAGYDPYNYSTYFIVLFVAAGLSQPRWTSLFLVVPALVAYLTPLVLAGEQVAFTAAIFDFPVFVLVAETIAWALSKAGRAQQERTRTNDRFRALAEYDWDLTLIIEDDGTVSYASPAAERILGLPADELVNQQAFARVHEDDLPRAQEVLQELVAHPGRMVPMEVRLRRRDGEWRWVEARSRNLQHLDSVGGFVLNVTDIHERKEVNRRLAFQAQHDQLTGLYNLRAALDELQGLVACREGELSVLFLDLDGFKPVNDRYGHAAGDELLRLVAGRLRSGVRERDLVARIGGDEFVIVVRDPDRSVAASLAQRLVEQLAQPFQLDERSVHVRASVGLAHHEHGLGVEELLRRADTTMYEAKRAGGGAWRSYGTNVPRQVTARASA